LESFNVLARLAKNQYEWKGVDQIHHSIQRMRRSLSEDNPNETIKKRK
jgi:hypothetical protein